MNEKIEKIMNKAIEERDKLKKQVWRVTPHPIREKISYFDGFIDACNEISKALEE